MHSPTQSTTGTWRQLLGARYLGTATVLAGGVALYATNVYLTTSLLPTAIDEVGGERYYAWTATVFLVASVISSMLVSKVLAARGPRGAYLIGLTVFALGTVVCAVSPTMELLLVGRTIQGAGGGLLAGLGYAVINAALPQHLWTRGAALVSAMWGVGTFAGPAVGGIFAQFGAWRMAFGVLVLAALAMAALVPRALPAHTAEATEPSPVPTLSLTLLTTAALLVSFAGVVSNLAITAAMVLGGVLLLIAFVAADRRAAHGVLPPSTFGASALKWIYLTIVVLAVASTVETFIPLFGQRLAGLAPLAAGFLGAALALGWTLGEIPSASATAPRVVRRIVIAGPILVAAGLCIVAAFLTDQAGAGSIATWVVGLLVAGVGIGIAWPHLAVGAMTSVAEPGEGARASAAINTVQLIANAFGAALAGVLVNLGEPSTLRSAQLLLFTSEIEGCVLIGDGEHGHADVHDCAGCLLGHTGTDSSAAGNSPRPPPHRTKPRTDRSRCGALLVTPCRRELKLVVGYEVPVTCDGVALAVFVGETVVVERHCSTGSLAEAVRAVVLIVVRRHRVCRGTCLLGRLHRDVPVPVDAGTSRDELTDDDVLLETYELVATAVDRRIGEHTSGLLEGRGREPRVGGQRRLGDTHQDRTSGCGLATLGDDATVARLEFAALGE